MKFLPQADAFNRCVLNNLLPTGDVVIKDGGLTTGVPNYKEFFQSLVGLSGESQNFDGNGNYTRFQTGGGDQTALQPARSTAARSCSPTPYASRWAPARPGPPRTPPLRARPGPATRRSAPT